MKVLVTGASGFLGGWLVRRLLNEPSSSVAFAGPSDLAKPVSFEPDVKLVPETHLFDQQGKDASGANYRQGAPPPTSTHTADRCEVRVLSRPGRSLGEIEGLPVEVAFGDVTDLGSLIEAARGVDTVFHLAGLIAYSRAQRPAMDAVNVQGTANVIQACEAAGVKKLVYMSSVVAIGASFDGTPLSEDSDYNVAHLDLGYFETKHKAEELVRTAVREGRIQAVILNPSTIYGPADAKKGSRQMQLKVARGQLPFYTSGGVNVVSVEDVVDCTISAWRRGRNGERYILAGENILIRDLFRIIAREAGVAPPRILLPRIIVFALGRIGDALEKIGKKGPLNSENAWTSTLYHWFDSSKAQRELGLRPKSAEYAISQSVRWMIEQGLIKS